MIIHLDMDGVLADFENGFKQHTGTGMNDFATPGEFWKFAQTFDQLFAELPMMHDAQELIDGVKDVAREYGFQIEILTAIPSLKRMVSAERDKEAWIKRHCPYGWKFKTGPFAVDKQNHAKPGDILIDDKIRNVDQWVAKGGIGILHESAKKTLKLLRSSVK